MAAQRGWLQRMPRGLKSVCSWNMQACALHNCWNLRATPKLRDFPSFRARGRTICEGNTNTGREYQAPINSSVLEHNGRVRARSASINRKKMCENEMSRNGNFRSFKLSFLTVISLTLFRRVLSSFLNFQLL